MQISEKSIILKKNTKFTKLNRLYCWLLKAKYVLSFFIGGIKQKQLLKLYNIVSTRRSFVNFLRKLECRIEFVLLKCGLVSTGKQARQLILHRHIFLNKVLVCARSILCKVGDVLSLSKNYALKFKFNLIKFFFKTPKFFKFLRRQGVTKKYTVQCIFTYFKFASFVEVNYSIFSVILVKQPNPEELFMPKLISCFDLNQLYFIL
jgi:ribosomal protein S4